MSEPFPLQSEPLRRARRPRRPTPELFVLLRRVVRLLLLYVRGQLLMSLIMGGITALVGLALGLKGALLLGLLAGVLETIPNFGSLIALVPAVVVALLYGSSIIPVDNWVFALIVIAAYFLVQQAGSLFIQPHLVGKSLNLPPLIVLFAVLLGAALFNVVGAYLAVPMVVTVREVGRYLWRKAKKLPPFEDGPEAAPLPSAPPPGPS